VRRRLPARGAFLSARRRRRGRRRFLWSASRAVGGAARTRNSACRPARRLTPPRACPPLPPAAGAQNARFFKHRIAYEEATLKRFFGEEYVRYAARTPTYIPVW